MLEYEDTQHSICIIKSKVVCIKRLSFEVHIAIADNGPIEWITINCLSSETAVMAYNNLKQQLQ